jgi:hypothetical protein
MIEIEEIIARARTPEITGRISMESYAKDAEGHEHDPTTGQFTGPGTTGLRHKKIEHALKAAGWRIKTVKRKRTGYEQFIAQSRMKGNRTAKDTVIEHQATAPDGTIHKSKGNRADFIRSLRKHLS